ncbi:MAG TPA: ATP-binding protein [Burkholderiaceae bacterium]|nr:ATP-binding protein [Burkholderiaceae bacterium]
MTQVVLTPSAEPRDTFWRTLLTFGITRIVIVAVLILYLIFNVKKGLDAPNQVLYWETCGAYLVLAIGFSILAATYRKRFLLQLWGQLTTDIFCISLLYVTAGGTKSGLAILYLFPLAGGAILTPLSQALFFVSVTTLVLFAESGYRTFTLLGEPTFLQAGLYGATFFAAAVVINRLAARLIRQEQLATRRGIDLRVQQAINRLIIADMGDGILVVGADSRILTANTAAERMLGLTINYGKSYYRLSDLPSLTPIADAFFAWVRKSADASDEQDRSTTFVVVKPGDDITLRGSSTVLGGRKELGAHLKLRFATVRTAGLGKDRVVIFLQDVTEIENQAQQLKLASMGRLTASIAHEVRNPLSAISYASSLLSEDAMNPAQTRLLDIIGDNVARLNRMIEDILKLSRKAQPHNEPLSLSPFFAEILGEFRGTHALPPDTIQLGAMDPYRIWFDPMHLREVMVNLLTNALRYASGARGSIQIFALPDIAGRLELHVQDDGPPIKPEVRAHLFEPFYTTSSKGTGLGLYLARELCLNNGAMIDYEYRVDILDDRLSEATGRFVITFALADPV